MSALVAGSHSPVARDVEPPDRGKTTSIPQVGGLHHHSRRAARVLDTDRLCRRSEVEARAITSSQAIAAPNRLTIVALSPLLAAQASANSPLDTPISARIVFSGTTSDGEDSRTNVQNVVTDSAVEETSAPLHAGPIAFSTRPQGLEVPIGRTRKVALRLKRREVAARC